ncbi:unnamed protein product [Blepharisma stoltei]|uniref:Maturase K n=1 Tax=Blepharisma stoltei TaxID=1481888 RepID=A0AAU9ICT2_9CILI|nr:unnamed protein product [Blepharisma stoltei]
MIIYYAYDFYYQFLFYNKTIFHYYKDHLHNKANSSLFLPEEFSHNQLYTMQLPLKKKSAIKSQWFFQASPFLAQNKNLTELLKKLLSRVGGP